jgi:voltage-gated potassium channel
MSQSVRDNLYSIIFGTDTPAGRRFDITLIVMILLSVSAVIIGSIDSIHEQHGETLRLIEWIFTLLFTAEYITRLYCSPKPWHYTRSFYGLVDLLSCLPTYIGIIFPAANHLLIIRLLRVLRIFRVLKLFRYMTEANLLMKSMQAARRKIFIFLFSVVVVVTIFGSLMFIIEGPANGFTSIPKSIYWAIVTVTTVGYGDVTPHTFLGQVVASLAMLTGYAIIAVPTGILSAEIMTEMNKVRLTTRCSNCEKVGHEADAEFCRYCGTELPLS